jgi:hypothetical protein
MINRRRLRCISCGTRIVTRTGIGHSNIQKHKFACPKCKVEIGYVLDLDQEAVKFEYRDPTNAVWDDGEDENDPAVLFYPEVMIPRNLESPLSPFIATFGNYKDIQDYQKFEATRRHYKEKFWPVLERAYVHFETGNRDLLEKEMLTILPSVPDIDDSEERGGWILQLSRRFFDLFVVDPQLSVPIERTVAYAVHRDARAVRRLAADYVRSGRMLALWKEIKSVRKQFLALYESLLPMLMVKRYWREDQQEIKAYELSIKNFEDLKGFYIDCVETTFRLLVIGLALELIATTGEPKVKTKKGENTIWWFEQLQNGIKYTQLKQHRVFDVFEPALDLALRNGVGHHAAHFDVVTDDIIYVKADDAHLTEMRLPYTEFVGKVFDAYCAFELATVFFQWFFVAGRGKLKKGRTRQKS